MPTNKSAHRARRDMSEARIAQLPDGLRPAVDFELLKALANAGPRGLLEAGLNKFAVAALLEEGFALRWRRTQGKELRVIISETGRTALRRRQ